MNPRRIFANLNVDLREFYRNKGTMFWTILFPILLMLLFGFIFGQEGDVSYSLPVQDKDGGIWATNLTEIIDNTEVFDIEVVNPDADPKEYMNDHDANVLLIIPEGYSESINQTLIAMSMGLSVNNTVNLTVLYDPTISSSPTKIQILDSIIQGLNKGLANAQDTIGIKAETTISEKFNFVDFFAPGIIAMSVMATSLFGTVTINTELRQKGVLRKLATTPLSRAEWLLSNIFYQLVMALISATAILLVGIVVFDLKFQLNIFLPLFVLLNVFSFSGIGMLITKYVKDAESAYAAANAVMFPMMFLAGTFFPLEMMPDFLQKIALVLPLYYVNEGLRDAMVHQNFGSALMSATIIGVFGIIVFILGVLLTSWQEE
jgi:ABC-2 type transport system permease protein